MALEKSSVLWPTVPSVIWASPAFNPPAWSFPDLSPLFYIHSHLSSVFFFPPNMLFTYHKALFSLVFPTAWGALPTKMVLMTHSLRLSSLPWALYTNVIFSVRSHLDKHTHTHTLLSPFPALSFSFTVSLFKIFYVCVECESRSFCLCVHCCVPRGRTVPGT